MLAKRGEELGRDRPCRRIACLIWVENAPIELGHGADIAQGARQEQFVGAHQVLAVEVALLDPLVGLGQELQQRATGDARQDAGWPRRSSPAPVYEREDMGRGGLRDPAIGAEHHAIGGSKLLGFS